jgi:hypothetical protein
MVEKEEEDSVPSVVFSEENRVYLEVLQRKQEMVYLPRLRSRIMLLTL